MATGDVYAPFLTSNAMQFMYAVPNTPSRVVYPAEAEALAVMGPIFAPGVYARDLNNIEIGSSGSIALSLLDKYTLTITKNSANATVFQSVDSLPISIQPGDAAKTVTVGDLTVSGTDVGLGAAGRRVNLGAPAFRFGNFLDVGQAAGGAALSSGAAPLSIVGAGTGFVDAATSFLVANVSRVANTCGVAMYTPTAGDVAQLASYVSNTSSLSGLALLANNLLLQGPGNSTMLSVSQAGGTTQLHAGSSTSPSKLQIVSTDPANTITIGSIVTSTYTDPLSGSQSAMIDTIGGLVDGAGFLFKEDVTIDPLHTLYLENICSRTGNIVLDAGIIIKGPLTVQDNGNVNNISWSNVFVQDKVITLSSGSPGTIFSNGSGFDVDCGANVAVLPSFIWNANNQPDTALEAATADGECFWRVSGGHLRVTAPNMEYGFRVNARQEFELFKCRLDGNGNQVGTATVVTRWGAAVPPYR